MRATHHRMSPPYAPCKPAAPFVRRKRNPSAALKLKPEPRPLFSPYGALRAPVQVMRASSISSGAGKTIVLVLSLAMSFSVCR